MKQSVFSALCVSLLLPVAAVAQEAAPHSSLSDTSAVVAASETPSETPKAENVPVLMKIKEISGKDRKIEYDYMGKQYGADIWLVSGTHVIQMIEVLPSGAAIIGGTFVSPEGQELGGALQKNFADTHHDRAQEILKQVRESLDKAPKAAVESGKPAPAAAITGAEVWNTMPKLGYVQYGSDDKALPVVYMVMDPAEPASKDAFAKLDAFAEAKKLNLRVVPITLTSTDTIMVLSNILAGSDQPKALKDFINGKRPAASAHEPPKPEGGLLLKNNADFVEVMKLDKLPSLFYRKSDADPIRAVKGTPKDWPAILKELGLE